MTDERSHDLEPDQAALDELMRAFADEHDEDDEDEASAELVIVEQSPVVDEWDQHLEPDDQLDDEAAPHDVDHDRDHDRDHDPDHVGVDGGTGDAAGAHAATPPDPPRIIRMAESIQ